MQFAKPFFTLVSVMSVAAHLRTRISCLICATPRTLWFLWGRQQHWYYRNRLDTWYQICWRWRPLEAWQNLYPVIGGHHFICHHPSSSLLAKADQLLGVNSSSKSWAALRQLGYFHPASSMLSATHAEVLVMINGHCDNVYLHPQEFFNASRLLVLKVMERPWCGVVVRQAVMWTPHAEQACSTCVSFRFFAE